MKSYLLPAFAIAALSAACNTHSATDADTAGRVALQVNCGIQTRACDDAWEDGDAIGIFMLGGTTVEASGRQYTTTGDGRFVPAAGQTIYFPEDGTGRDFMAFYPYSASLSGGRTYSIDVSRQDPQRAIDLMGTDRVRGKNADDPAVAFTFTHKLVKLDIRVQGGDGMDGITLAGTTVVVTGQQTAGTYDAVDGGAVVPAGAATAAITLVAAGDGSRYEGIVLPAGDTGGMQLRLTVPELDNCTFDWDIKKSPLSQRFEAGKKYRYTVVVNRTELVVNSSIVPWEPVGPVSGSAVME